MECVRPNQMTVFLSSECVCTAPTLQSLEKENFYTDLQMVTDRVSGTCYAKRYLR